MKWILTIALLCASETIKSKECNVACKYLGSHGGTYEDGYCYCFDRKPYGDLVGREITILPKKSAKPSSTW